MGSDITPSIGLDKWWGDWCPHDAKTRGPTRAGPDRQGECEECLKGLIQERDAALAKAEAERDEAQDTLLGYMTSTGSSLVSDNADLRARLAVATAALEADREALERGVLAWLRGSAEADGRGAMLVGIVSAIEISEAAVQRIDAALAAIRETKR